MKLDEGMLARIDDIYQAGLKRMPDAGDWYADTFSNIQGLMAVYDSRGRGEADEQRTILFIDLLAATSPRTPIIRNTFLASQLLHYIHDGIICKIKMAFEAHLNNVCRAILGLPLSGQKVLSFQANLLGDKNAVTVDVWMMKVFAMDHDAPTTAEYDDIARATRKLAKQYGVSPAAMQATLWVGIKALEGDPSDTPEPFEKTLARFKAHEDAQGMIDFTGAESKFKAAEAAAASGARAEAANPGFSSPRVIGPRLKELCRAEAGITDEIVDILCEQPPELVMEGILFIREKIGSWQRGKGNPLATLQAYLEEIGDDDA